jgi:hypothetical protein
MKMTKAERDRWRDRMNEDGIYSEAAARLLDDADRCEDLEDRVSLLEEVLRAVDAALENEFGGFYLSAPEDSQLYDIREMLRGER